LKTWDEVVEKFLKKYFPESKNAEGKAAISSFHQFPHEYLSEALEVQRFIEKNSHPWVFRANSIEYVYRWVETTNQAIARCFCRGKDKTEDPGRSN